MFELLYISLSTWCDPWVITFREAVPVAIGLAFEAAAMTDMALLADSAA
jgi:hypothetical protein